MKKEKKIISRMIFMIFAVATIAMGCDQLSLSSTDSTTPETTPTASIQVDNATLLIGSQVTVNGQGSSDPQGELLTYAWTMPEKPAGSAATLSSNTDPIVTFTADNGGYYSVILQVTNVSGIVSAAQTLRIDAVGSGSNHPPVANAGTDQTAVDVGEVAILDALASSDADQDVLRFKWSLLSIPATSTVTKITDDELAIAFLFPDVVGDYFIKLVVSDGQDNDLDFVIITAK